MHQQVGGEGDPTVEHQIQGEQLGKGAEEDEPQKDESEEQRVGKEKGLIAGKGRKDSGTGRHSLQIKKAERRNRQENQSKSKEEMDTDIDSIKMELELQESKYKTKKKEVDKLSKVLEDVIQLSNANSQMGEEEILKLVKYYEEQIQEKS